MRGFSFECLFHILFFFPHLIPSDKETWFPCNRLKFHSEHQFISESLSLPFILVWFRCPISFTTEGSCLTFPSGLVLRVFQHIQFFWGTHWYCIRFTLFVHPFLCFSNLNVLVYCDIFHIVLLIFHHHYKAS